MVPCRYSRVSLLSFYEKIDIFQEPHIYLSLIHIYAQGASNATELKEITVDSANTVYASAAGVLFTKDYSEILHYPMKNTSKLFTIPKETISFDIKQTFISPYLENIYVEKENEKYSSYEGAVYNKDKTELIIIPEGKKSVTVLGNVDFSKSELSPFNSCLLYTSRCV